MAFCDAQYYERIGAIQQSLNEREKRRLELERELFAYSRSDKRISQVKCSKLSGYLKEICERERQAKMRNMELLREVECIEMNLKDHPDQSPLQQQKMECLNRISKFMAVKKMKEEQTVEANKQDGSQTQLAKDLYQPAGIFQSHQTSAVSAAEDATTSVPSWQSPHGSSNRRPRSSERPPSGLLKGSKVTGEAAADSRARLSDDISGSNDSPDGCDLSDKHERTAAAVPSVRALAAGAGVPFGADEQQPPSPPATLTRPGKDTAGSVCERNSPAEFTRSGEDAHQDAIKEREARGPRRSTSETEFGIESQDETERSVSVPSSSVELSVTSSLTESDLEEDVLHQHDTHPSRRSGGPGAERSAATPLGSELHSSSPQSLESPHEAGPKTGPRSSRGSTPPETSPERLLSLEGLFHLLESVEARLAGEQTNVYRGSSVSERQRKELISLCNAGAAGLNGEDLEACGAVVLHQLQRLSWSTSKGSLLPEEIVSAHRSNTKPENISSSLPRDAAPLWDRWFKHALLLKDQRVLSTERLVQLFTPLLLQQHASYSRQAKVLLRTLLSRPSEAEEGPSAESETSSCDLPLCLGESGEARPARPAREQHGTAGIQGVQSGEEDSQDESPVEGIPIKETKAYQLLKQSAMQERLQSFGEEEEEEEEEEDLSGKNDGCDEDRRRAERSSHQDPYPRKGKKKQNIYSTVQSKAFWGESDSESEIEAAVRPQPYNTNTDDFDDFYD